ncbi:MAG TPA: hypothetical protein VJV58_21710 [Bradyrhizobium sp.]|jgi:hypothetical protein|nr:hypothetical protein [Bradyrhizobium sp.]HKO73555.1 hypothetical protein [Bradyrhizobium sp.]
MAGITRREVGNVSASVLATIAFSGLPSARLSALDDSAQENQR